MLHYTCDCCQRPIDADKELRYVARVEVYAAIDPSAENEDDERDHLQEIQDILERLDDEDDRETAEEVYHQRRFDLCAQCRSRFVKNPLGRFAMQGLGFSKN